MCVIDRGLRKASQTFLAVLILLQMVSCAGRTSRPPSDTAEAVFATSEDVARTAVVKVLAEQGYDVTVDEAGRFIRTDYRKETDGPWDPLIVSRFGTIRSRVEATIASESDVTRVKIDVFVEGKDSLLGTWRPFDAPLPQAAATHLRQVRKALTLL
jgi:hypothetical protein